MTANQTCWNGGAVGGPQIDIPADPTRFRVDQNDRIGCNSLACPSCKNVVRHVDGVRLAGFMSSTDKIELYESPNPEQTRFVGTGGAGTEFRVYFCRCTAHSIAGFEEVDLTDYGWTCAGHNKPTST